MRLNFGDRLEIQDLGNHPAWTVIKLGILLAGGVDARPDLKRKDLYEVESVATVYYIYVSPVTGTISLIATWKKVARLDPSKLCLLPRTHGNDFPSSRHLSG
jgi:hypothetical protein